MSGIVGDNVARASGVIAAAGGGGKLLQVVQYVRTATSGSTGSTSMTDITDFKVAITPAAESSKMLVSFNIAAGSSGAGQHFQITRDIAGGGFSTLTDFIGDSRGSRTRVTAGSIGIGTTLMVPFTQQCLDTPSYSSGDEITYQMQWYQESPYTGWINRQSSNADNYYNDTQISTMTVMEIGA